MFPELFGCDGSKHNERDGSGDQSSVWHDEDYKSSAACSANVELGEHTELPDGFGVRVGPQDNITQILFCNHYHDHMNLNELLTYRSENATLSFQLRSSSPRHPLTPIATIFVATTVGHIPTPDGFRMRVSHKFDESAVFHVLFIRIHMHAYAHRADRGIAWITNATGQHIITNTSVFGNSDFFPAVPDAAFVIIESDALTVECDFKRKPNQSEQDLRYVVCPDLRRH